MNKLYKWIRLPFQVIYILLCLYQQKRFNQKYLKPIVQPYFKNSDSTLKTEDYTKIFSYYGLAIPAILGNLICYLRGSRMTHKERLLCTYQAALTGLVDDYFDEHNMSTDRLYRLLEMTEDPYKSNEKLGVELYLKSEILFHNRIEIKKALESVISSQDLSKKQLVKGLLSYRELFDVTLYKGGTSFVFYALLFFTKLTKNEKQFFYQLGGITQFGNDIFDLYKDRESNVDTLLTTTDNIGNIKELYLTQVKVLFKFSEKLPYVKGRVTQFMEYYTLGVISRCLVCLEQYEVLQQNSNNGKFEIDLYTRKELICDMEKLSNLMKALKIDIKKEANVDN